MQLVHVCASAKLISMPRKSHMRVFEFLMKPWSKECIGSTASFISLSYNQPSKLNDSYPSFITYKKCMGSAIRSPIWAHDQSGTQRRMPTDSVGPQPWPRSGLSSDLLVSRWHSRLFDCGDPTPSCLRRRVRGNWWVILQGKTGDNNDLNAPNAST